MRVADQSANIKPGTWIIKAPRRKAHITFIDFDGYETKFGFALKFNLRAAPDAEIDYNRRTAVPVTELTPMQLMRAGANFMQDPFIGSLLGNFFADLLGGMLPLWASYWE